MRSGFDIYIAWIIQKYLPQRHQDTKKQEDRSKSNFKLRFVLLFYKLHFCSLFFINLCLCVFVAKEYFRIKKFNFVRKNFS